MPIEMTKNRLKNLAMHEGEITIEGEHQNEIVIRIPFGEYNEGAQEAEGAYNALYDIEDDRCQECGRYTPESLKDGLCWHCRGWESPPPKQQGEADNERQDTEAARCDICGRKAEGSTDGLCKVCEDLPISAIEEDKLHELILKILGL